jgi:hypothetical protein
MPSFKSHYTSSVDWKSTLIPVIPAEAGIQAVFEREPRTNLDAGLRRHDELSLRLKARFQPFPREISKLFREGHLLLTTVRNKTVLFNFLHNRWFNELLRLRILDGFGHPRKLAGLNGCFAVF